MVRRGDDQEIVDGRLLKDCPRSCPGSPARTIDGKAEDLDICRILNGMWQVSGAHGRIDPKTAIQSMFNYIDAGFTTWDLADHYGPAEDFIGEFRRQLVATRGEAALSNLQAFTKWVPRPTRMTRKLVEENIDIFRSFDQL